jgi:hypothetical protein
VFVCAFVLACMRVCRGGGGGSACVGTSIVNE